MIKYILDFLRSNRPPTDYESTLTRITHFMNAPCPICSSTDTDQSIYAADVYCITANQIDRICNACRHRWGVVFGIHLRIDDVLPDAGREGGGS